jgi:hypothetical protein
MVILRRSNCINTASGIVTPETSELSKNFYNTSYCIVLILPEEFHLKSIIIS